MSSRFDDNETNLVGQLEWFADELQAQRRFIRQLPEAQLTAAPVEGEPSIREMYERLLNAERDRHLPEIAEALEADSPEVRPSTECESVDELLDVLSTARRHLVAILRKAGSEGLTRTVGRADGDEDVNVREYAYNVALNDGEILRAVSERFYESDLRFSSSSGVTK